MGHSSASAEGDCQPHLIAKRAEMLVTKRVRLWKVFDTGIRRGVSSHPRYPNCKLDDHGIMTIAGGNEIGMYAVRYR
jgi:hypothetical protein